MEIIIVVAVVTLIVSFMALSVTSFTLSTPYDVFEVN